MLFDGRLGKKQSVQCNKYIDGTKPRTLAIHYICIDKKFLLTDNAKLIKEKKHQQPSYGDLNIILSFNQLKLPHWKMSEIIKT